MFRTGVSAFVAFVLAACLALPIQAQEGNPAQKIEAGLDKAADGQFREAVALWLEALGDEELTDGQRTEVHLYLGLAYKNLKEYPEAWHHLSKFLNKKTEADASRDLGEVTDALEKEGYEKVIINCDPPGSSIAFGKVAPVYSCPLTWWVKPGKRTVRVSSERCGDIVAELEIVKKGGKGEHSVSACGVREAADGEERKELRIVYSAPREFLETYFVTSASVPTTEDFRELQANATVSSNGIGAMGDGQRYLVPPDSMTDFNVVPDFLANAASAKRRVLDPELPVLVSPLGIIFQYPYHGHLNCIRELEKQTGPLAARADTTRTTAALVEYTFGQKGRVLSLEFVPSAPLVTDESGYERVIGLTVRAATDDDEVTLYTLVLPLFHPARVKEDVRRLMTVQADSGLSGGGEARAAKALFLHTGGIVSKATPAERRTFVASQLNELNPFALVPRHGELTLGPDELENFVRQSNLPYIAANLRRRVKRGQDSKASRLFPRFLLETVDGLTVGVIGLVGPLQTGPLPSGIRERWEVEPLRPALESALDALHKRLGRRPDVTVVLLASSSEQEFESVMGSGQVDLVIGHFTTWQMRDSIERLEVPSSVGGREKSSSRRALYGVVASGVSIGNVDLSFASRKGEPARFIRLVHRRHRVDASGPRDSVLERTVREFWRTDYPAFFDEVLPDVAPIVKKHPELEDLVWGDRILFNNSYTSRPKSQPAVFTDPLAMRFAMNSVRKLLGTEIAISRSVLVASLQIGTTGRGVLQTRLGIMDEIVVLNLTGAEVAKVAGQLALQRHPGKVRPANHLFVSGLNPDLLRVGGRALDPQEKYSVALTDFVMNMPELEGVFRGKKPVVRFRKAPDGRYAPDSDGEAITVAEVVLTVVDGWAGPEARSFDKSRTPEFVDMLQDHSNRLEGRWRLRIGELSVSGASFANTGTAGAEGAYAESSEMRVNGKSPDNYTVALGADVGLGYDGPVLAWENGLAAKLQRTVDDTPGANPVEQMDDLVSFTELRLNIVRMEVGTDRFPVVPYVRGEHDTEITAPSGSSRQQLLRFGSGFVTYPGPRLKEIRLGAVWQTDFSTDNPTNDVGLALGYRAKWPLLPHLVWESTLDLRYFFPDNDDSLKDLGMVLESVNKLAVPIYGGLSLFGSVDLYLVQGKRDSNRDPAGSYILGVGLQFADVFKL